MAAEAKPAAWARQEETWVAQAMQMLGFRETERILVTGVFPGQSGVRLSAGREKEIVGRAERWLVG